MKVKDSFTKWTLYWDTPYLYTVYSVDFCKMISPIWKSCRVLRFKGIPVGNSFAHRLQMCVCTEWMRQWSFTSRWTLWGTLFLIITDVTEAVLLLHVFQQIMDQYSSLNLVLYDLSYQINFILRHNCFISNSWLIVLQSSFFKKKNHAELCYRASVNSHWKPYECQFQNMNDPHIIQKRKKNRSIQSNVPTKRKGKRWQLYYYTKPQNMNVPHIIQSYFS